MSDIIQVPNVMRMAWLRVCWLPAPIRVTAGRAVPTHYASCPRRSQTLPKFLMVPRTACVRDKHALRTRHTERFDLQKGLRDRSSPTCTLSQNGYGESLILRFGSPKKLQKGCGRGGKEPNLQKSRNVDSVCSFIPCIPISLPCACSFRFPDLHH